MRKLSSFLLIVLSLVSVSGFSQQDPQYTQYMYNMNIINPAYMINEPGLVEVGALYRTQWVGIDGAPKTGNVFANIPLSDRIEISINYLNDEIGQNIKQTENVFNVDAAYKMKINETLDLSFGMKAGFDHFSTSFNESNVSSDPLFANTKKTVLNIGAGVFLFQEKYYVGLSKEVVILVHPCAMPDQQPKQSPQLSVAIHKQGLLPE